MEEMVEKTVLWPEGSALTKLRIETELYFRTQEEQVPYKFEYFHLLH